eukprot:9351319-Heterocapsa_arctica.AAC.1
MNMGAWLAKLLASVVPDLATAQLALIEVLPDLALVPHFAHRPPVAAQLPRHLLEGSGSRAASGLE